MKNLKNYPLQVVGLVAIFNQLENKTSEALNELNKKLGYHGYKLEGEELVQITPTRDAYEIKQDAIKYVDAKFNFIQLSTLKAVLGEDGYLIEHIRPLEDIDCAEHVWNEYLTEEEKKDIIYHSCPLHEGKVLKALQENALALTYYDVADYIKADQDELNEAVKEQNEDAFLTFAHGDNNYPMWNTLFEFKEQPSKEIVQAAINAGFGVIEHEDFNTMLFVSGAGYSFYSAHWIPFYLGLPWVNVNVTESYQGQ